MKGDLDSDLSQFARTREFTEGLIDILSEKKLWKDHGIVSPVEVRQTRSFFPIALLSNFQPFTTSFKRADIYELIAPDLLHQVIKGTFKDHLVSWVEEYVRSVHPRHKAEKILDDIDRR